MRGYVLAVLLSLSLVMPGCASFRESATKAVDEYLETVKTEKELVKKLLKEWPYQSCKLRAALGSRWNWLPGEAQDAWEALDSLVGVKQPEDLEKGSEIKAVTTKQFDAGELSDCELGSASGHAILLTFEVVRKALEMIAPDVTDILPSFT